MLEISSFAYISIEFKRNYAGEVEHELQYVPISDPYLNVSFFQVIIEGCIIVFMFYYNIRIYLEIRNRRQVYLNYYCMNIESELQPCLLYHRERKMPESFRELKYLFNWGKILDMIFNINLMISIGVWIYIILKINSVKSIKDNASSLDNKPKEMEELADKFYYISQRMEWGRVFECMTIVVLSIKILTYLSSFSTLRVIIITLEKSIKMIPPMLFIMLGYLCAFSFMIHFLYGS